MKTVSFAGTLSCVLGVLLVARSGEAQGPINGVVEGRITAAQGSLPNHLSVELVAEGHVAERVSLSLDGSFRMPNIPPGRYGVRVVDLYGTVLRHEDLAVHGNTAQVDMRLPGERQQRSPTGPISIRSLANPLPKNVKKELRKAEQAAASDRIEESFEHLNRALSLCPNCVEVHINLGARYLRAGSLDRAVAAFERAVEIDPESTAAQNNLAVAMVISKDYGRAEQAARKALELDPSSSPAHYAMGLAALARRSCDDATLKHLHIAAEKYPRAHLSVAQVLLCRGDRQMAISELAAYLEKPEPEHRANVEKWLVTLKQQQTNK